MGGGIIDSRLILDEIVIQIAVRWAVPCFLMITGYLLLDRGKSISKKNVYRYTTRILIVLLAFGFLFCVMEAYVGGIRGISLVTTSILNLIEGNSWSHMWYLYMIIGIYLLLPLFKRYTECATLNEQRLVILVLIIFTIGVPTINQFFGVHIVTLLPLNSSYVAYVLFGGLIRNFGGGVVKHKYTLLFVGIIGFCAMLYLKLFSYNVSYNPDNIFVCLYSMGLFAICCESRWLEKIADNCVVGAISKYSFGIYVIHPVILNTLMKGMHIYPDVLPVIAGEVVFLLFALIGGFALTWLITRIPLCKRFLL